MKSRIVIKKINIKYLVCLLFFSNVSLFAQSSVNDVMDVNINPKDVLPPEIAKMAEYGDYTANLNKGKPNISIPIYTIETKNGLQIPISLDYVSKGVKVDELASNVGLGWLLSTGGVITIENEAEGHYNIGNRYKQRILDWAGRDIISITNEPGAMEMFSFLEELRLLNTPTQPEIYHINCFGLTGSFIVDSKKKIHNIPASELVVTISDDKQQISVRDKHNNNYNFRKHYSNTYVEAVNAPILISPSSFFVLYRIELNNSEVVDFEYNLGGGGELKNVEFKYDHTPADLYKEGKFNPPLSRCDRRDFPQNTKGILYGSISNFNIKRITYGKQEVRFTYSDQQGYYIANDRNRKDSEGAVAIRKIDVLDNNIVVDTYQLDYNYFKSSGGEGFKYYRLKLQSILKNHSEKHSFEYNERVSLPARLSFSQDAWGLNNGRQNSTLLPSWHVGGGDNIISLQGADRGLGDLEQASAFLLNKIIYPTRGYTEFQFERDKIFINRIDKVAVPKVFSISARRDASEGSSSDFGYAEKEYEGDIGKVDWATLRLFFGNPCDNNIPGPTQIGRYSNGFVTVLYNNQGGGTFSYAQNQALRPGLIGPLTSLKLRLEWDNCSPTASLHWIEYHYIEIRENIDIGTLRLASYRSYSENGILDKSVRYEYFKPNSQESSFSGGAPTLIAKTSKVKQDVTYHPDPRANSDYALDGTYDCLCTVRSDSSMDNYDESKNGYRHVQEIVEAQGSKEYEFINLGTGGKLMLTNEFPEFEYPYGRYRTKDYWTNGLPLSERHLDSDNKLVYQLTNKYEFDPRFNSASADYVSGKNISYGLYLKGKYIVAFSSYVNIEAISYGVYNISSAWIKKVETKVEDYRLSRSLSSTTKYFYENDAHLQLSKQETVFSNNDILTQKFYYPHDLNLSLLSDRKGELVKMETYKNGALLSQTNKVFKNWGNGLIDIEKIEQAKGTQPLTTEAKVIQRDLANGNVLEVEANGKTTVYLYGYNKKYLVAKIENTTRAIVALAMGMNPTDLLNIDSTKFTQLNNLRNHSLLKEALVSTYEYKPLVGVSKMTDPMGLSTTYEYDAANKLKQVKDHKGNILSDYEYNFKTL